MTQKFNILSSAALSSKYDCSYLGSPLRLLSVIKRASAHEGALVLLDVILGVCVYTVPVLYM